MPETRTATLFMIGATRDKETGDVVLSTRPGSRDWADFFALMRSNDVPDEFMAERPMNVLPPRRGIFG